MHFIIIQIQASYKYLSDLGKAGSKESGYLKEF